MKVRFRKIDKDLPTPEHKTKGAEAIDLYSREEITIKPHELGYIPLNNAIEIPEGYFGMLVARSSTHKLGLMPSNGIGVWDSDFNGDNDEAKFIVYNFSDSDVIVEKGFRIAQLVLIKHERFDLEEVETLGNKDRGGLGSTGNK